MLEVLAPIGSIGSLKAAIYSGADAVYLGLDLFNARIKADNFNKDNIAQWVDYCHLFNVKVYITFNTNIKESEREIFAQYVDIAAKANVDAFIVTDLGCLDILKRYDVPLHGSTQIGVHNLAGAKVLEELGFTRVVLARETLSSDIRKIKENTNLEIEHFVHGALCVCFSGSCLMSSMMSGDSGNRGRCNQPCRLKYKSSISDKNAYLLSPKDQCLIDKVQELAELGVDSLKIEGRLKQPHYVGEAVAQYRRAVDNVVFHKKDKIDYDALKAAYNRGNFTLGYNYHGTKDIIYDKLNGNIGLQVGSVISSKKNMLNLSLQRELKKGDGVKILYNGQELGGFAVEEIAKVGKNYQVKTKDSYPTGSTVHLTLDSNQVQSYSNLSPKLSISFDFEAKLGKNMRLTARCGDIDVEATGDISQKGISQCADRQSVTKQLLKLGDSVFAANLSIDMDDCLFIAVSSLNALRRSVIEKLQSEILKRYDIDKQRVEYADSSVSCYKNQKSIDKDVLYIEADFDNIDYIINVKNKFALILNFQQDDINIAEILTKLHLIKKYTECIYLKLPRIARGKDYDNIEDFIVQHGDIFDGIAADNIYGIYLAKKYNKILMGGIGLNVYNSGYAKVMGLDLYINSVELNNMELCGGITYAYGRLPIMTLLHCPVQVNSGCDCSTGKYDGDFYYYDKRGSYLIERIKLNYCQFIVYNQQIIDIRNKIKKFSGEFYINLCGVKGQSVGEIIDDFAKKQGRSQENSTYGHLFRGVK